MTRWNLDLNRRHNTTPGSGVRETTLIIYSQFILCTTTAPATFCQKPTTNMADEGEQEPVKPVSVIKLYRNEGNSDGERFGFSLDGIVSEIRKSIALSDYEESLSSWLSYCILQSHDYWKKMSVGFKTTNSSNKRARCPKLSNSAQCFNLTVPNPHISPSRRPLIGFQRAWRPLLTASTMQSFWEPA